jgi:uncharacterized membrane protein YphA (DoxX/SURF4 family)
MNRLANIGDVLVPRGIEAGVGLLFILAGGSKLGAIRVFADDVHGYALTSVEASRWIALLLPWVEIVLGIQLLLGLGAALPVIAAGLMLLAFLIAQLAALWRGLTIDCGCSLPGVLGSGDQSIGVVSILRLLLLLCLLAVALPCRLRTRKEWVREDRRAPDRGMLGIPRLSMGVTFTEVSS